MWTENIPTSLALVSGFLILIPALTPTPTPALTLAPAFIGEVETEEE